MAPFLYPKINTNERWWCMARAPDARMEQARDLFLKGKKLIEISDLLKIPEGTIRSWKNRYGWDNATLQKRKAASREIRMLPETRAVPLRRKIRMQLLRESLRLSFLIVWIWKSSVWCRQYQRTSRRFLCRRYSF